MKIFESDFNFISFILKTKKYNQNESYFLQQFSKNQFKFVNNVVSI